jgi:Asp-tRNA(Asn)/Glu-tRNA(Gln) amidotransferase A subunit family amidase
MSDFSPLMSATLPQDEQRPSGRDLDALEKARTTASSPQKRPLRIAIVTENFLPKIDGVTRTLAMLLEHLQAEGHEAMVLGPATPLVRSHLANSHMLPSGTERVLEQRSYAGAEVVATKGIPLLGVYRGLGLNFLRPKFIRKLRKHSYMA